MPGSCCSPESQTRSIDLQDDWMLTDPRHPLAPKTSLNKALGLKNLKQQGPEILFKGYSYVEAEVSKMRV